MPLALAQASWGIGQRRRRKPAYGFAEYARDLDALPLDRVLTAERGGEYPLKTAQAIELSVRTMLGACGDASLGTAVLGVLAHLDPAGGPVAWFDALDDDTVGTLDSVLDAMEAGAIATPSEDGTRIVMHRLVGRLLRGRPGTMWGEVSEHVADVLASIEPLSASGFWEQRESTTLLSGHLLAAFGYSAGNVPERLIDSAAECGGFLTALHLPQMASVFLERLIETAERVVRPDHQTVLASRSNLAYACAYTSAGDPGRAVPLFERTLADRVRVQGPDHLDSLSSRCNLASAYAEVGDLGRAVPLFEQNLADRVRVLGPDHPTTLSSREILALALVRSGQPARALELARTCWRLAYGRFGPSDWRTLGYQDTVGYVQAAAGDVDMATKTWREAQSVALVHVGADHHITRLLADRIGLN